MNKSASPLAILPALLLAPAVAMACGGCVDADMYAAAPWFHVTGAVLVLWAIVNWIYVMIVGLSNPPQGGGGNSFVANFFMAIIMIWLLFAGGSVGVLILLIPLLGYRLFREILAPRSSYPAVGRTLAIGALLVMMTTASVGIAWRAGMNELEAFMRLSSPSTSMGRSKLVKFAKDPDLTAIDFRYWLIAGDSKQMTNALLILERRKCLEDLITLQDVVIPILPETKPECYTSWGEPAYHVEQWLRTMGYKDIQTRPDLQELLERYADGNLEPPNIPATRQPLGVARPLDIPPSTQDTAGESLAP